MNIQLSDHFTYKRLLRFVLPSTFNDYVHIRLQHC